VALLFNPNALVASRHAVEDAFVRAALKTLPACATRGGQTLLRTICACSFAWAFLRATPLLAFICCGSALNMVKGVLRASWRAGRRAMKEGWQHGA